MCSISPEKEQAVVQAAADTKKTKKSRKGIGGRPKLIKSVKILEQAEADYFAYLETTVQEQVNQKTGIKTYSRVPAYYGSYLLWLGKLIGKPVTYQKIAPYENGEYDTDDNKFSEVLARVKMRCEEDLFVGSSQGVYQDRTVLSALSRHHGFAQKLELTGANGGPIEFKGVLAEWAE